MTLLSVALSNVKENLRNYLGFFVSFASSVMVYYIFHGIATAPEVTGGGYFGTRTLLQLLSVGRWGIAVFSFFFIWYANAVLLNSRKRDLGILSLLGASSRQLLIMVFLETLFIGIASLVVGLFAGVLFSRLITMAVAAILDVHMSIPSGLRISITALHRTCLVFAGIFVGIGLLNTFSLRSQALIDLVKASQKPKTPPKASIILALGAVACLGGGYWWAYTLATPVEVVIALFPVTGVVSLGTYLLFTQLSVAVLGWLSRRRGLYYRRTNLITLSDLIFQMKDNARVLAVITILSAVIMSLAGAVYSLGQRTMELVEENYSRTLWFALLGTEDGFALCDDFQRSFQAEGAKLAEDVAKLPYLHTLRGDSQNKGSGEAQLISVADYNAWAQQAGERTFQLAPGQAIRLMGRKGTVDPWFDTDQTTSERFLLGETILDVEICGHMPTSLVGVPYSGLYLVLIHPMDYDRLASSASKEAQGVLFSCDVYNWRSAIDAERIAQKILPEEHLYTYGSQISAYAVDRSQYQMIMFVMTFLIFLFFLASGSMLYCRFFLQLQDDQEKFTALRRLGLSLRELRTIVSREMAILFFAPWVVAVVHQTFAMDSFSVMLGASAWHYGAVVAILFLIPQTLYFILARSAYLRELVSGVR